MLISPKWARLMPDYMRPPRPKIKQLEHLRILFKLPHDLFSQRVTSSRITTIKVQKYLLEQYRIQMPDASEKELWACLLASRLDSYKQSTFHQVKTGIIPEDKADEKMDQLTNLFGKYADNYEGIIDQFNSFDEFCEHLIGLDQEFVGDTYSSYDPHDIGELIDKILEE